jgi:hypothetical protein
VDEHVGVVCVENIEDASLDGRCSLARRATAARQFAPSSPRVAGGRFSLVSNSLIRNPLVCGSHINKLSFEVSGFALN